MDAVTIASVFTGQAEGVEGARATEEAVLAAADLEHVAVATDTSLAASDAVSATADESNPANPWGRAFIRLYRAVTSDELSSIKQANEYSNAGGRLYKYFGYDAGTAIKFGTRMENSGFGPMFLTSGKFPRSLLSQTIIKPIAEGTEVVIPNELLDQFQEGSITIHGWIKSLDIP